MRYLMIGLLSIFLVFTISGCKSSDEMKPDGKAQPNDVVDIEDKQYTSIEDYQKEIPTNMKMNKPVFKLVSDNLEVSFEVKYTEELDTKLRNTKQPSYYSVIEAEGNDKFDNLLDKDNPPIYSNRLVSLEMGNFGYKYKIVLPLKGKPTDTEKKELLNGSNFALIFMNQDKETTNVFHVLDVGMV